MPEVIKMDNWYAFTIVPVEDPATEVAAVFTSQMECRSTNKDAAAKQFHVYFNSPQGSEVLHISSSQVLEFSVGETYRIQIGEQDD